MTFPKGEIEHSYGRAVINGSPVRGDDFVFLSCTVSGIEISSCKSIWSHRLAKTLRAQHGFQCFLNCIALRLHFESWSFSVHVFRTNCIPRYWHMIPKLLFESSSYDKLMPKVHLEKESVRSAQGQSENDLWNKSAIKCLGLVPCCSVMLSAVWYKLG